MNNQNIVTLKNISYETSSRPIFRDVSFAVNSGDRIGLVGSNGIGKTTLLKIINDDLEQTEGKIFNNGSTIGLLPQNMQNYLDDKVHDFVERITGVSDARDEFENSCKLLEGEAENALAIYTEAFEKLNKLDVSGFDQNLIRAFGKVGLIDINFNKKINEFSGGQQQKIALAAILASKQDLVLLDEPTNSLDEQGIIFLEKIISESPATFLVVSHDRRFLRNISNRIIELMGIDGARQYNLGYDEYVDARKDEKKSEEAKYEQYQTEKKRMQKSAKAANAKANNASKSTKKDDNDKLNNNARKENATVKLGQNAKSIQGKINKMDIIEEPNKGFSLKFNINQESRKKSSGIDVRNLSISYNGNKEIGPYSFSARIGERISLTGANGSGKSSILQAINGICEGEISGEIKKNASTKIISIDQGQTLPMPNNTAFENLQSMTEAVPKHELIITLLQFGLNKDVINVIPAHLLSGGERMKVLLAATKLNQAEILIMDEPTNNLDIPTVEGLSTALRSFQGTIIVVSHDRDFLDELNITKSIEIK